MGSGWTAVLALLGTVVVALGGYWTARATSKASPYAELADRVVELEKADREKARELACLRDDVDGLRRTEGRLVGWVARLHHGITDGTIPPLPAIPDWLTGLLDQGREEL